MESDKLVLFSTYFKSEPFEVSYELPTGYGGTYTETEVRHKVIRFEDETNLTHFTVNENNEILENKRM